MSPQPDLSVIIAVYNTAAYLAQCIASVQRQTGLSLEIICIDDGSQDSSAEILAGLAAEDDRIVVVRQPNAGQSAARNAGIERARGRYLCFLDSDDYYASDGLGALVRRADEESLDLLLFDADAVREPGASDALWRRFETYYRRSDTHRGVLTGVEMIAELRPLDDYRVSPCLYLVRRDFLTGVGLRFVSGVIHEDNPFTFALFVEAQRVGHTATPLYVRRVRAGSTTTAVSRLASARGYFVSYLHMSRRVTGRELEPHVARHIGTMIAGMLERARRVYVTLEREARQELRDLDAGVDAQIAWSILERAHDLARAQAAAKRSPATIARSALRRARRVAGRAARRGTAFARGLIGGRRS